MLRFRFLFFLFFPFLIVSALPTITIVKVEREVVILGAVQKREHESMVDVELHPYGIAPIS